MRWLQTVVPFLCTIRLHENTFYQTIKFCITTVYIYIYIKRKKGKRERNRKYVNKQKQKKQMPKNVQKWSTASYYRFLFFIFVSFSVDCEIIFKTFTCINHSRYVIARGIHCHSGVTEELCTIFLC